MSPNGTPWGAWLAVGPGVELDYKMDAYLRRRFARAMVMEPDAVKVWRKAIADHVSLGGA